MVERRFKREISSLEAIFDFVAEFLATNGIPPSNSFYADLLIEELFTNMVKYSKEGTHDIAIRLDRDSSKLVISLEDFDVDAFDITQSRELDMNQSMRERKAGGLGLHFVKQIADSVHYEYKDRNSTITVIRRLEP